MRKNSHSLDLGFGGRATDRSFLGQRRGLRTRHLGLVPAVGCIVALLAACGDDSSTPIADGGPKDATHADTGDGAAARDTGNADTGSDAAVDATMGDGGSSDGPVAPAAGSSGGPCYDGGTCDTGLICGDAGVCAPPPPYCDSQPKKALPYNIIPDYGNLAISGPGAPNFTIISNPDCNATTFPTPPSPFPPEAGADGGDAASADAGDAGSGADAANADAAADAAPEAEAGPPPACYEFLYNPTTNVTGSAYGVAVFENTLQGSASPGLCIAPGAVGVAFWARASRDGTIVKFGSTTASQCLTPRPIANDPVIQQASCMNYEFFLSITTTWQRYIVSVPVGQDYNNVAGNAGGVWNGFSIVVEPTDFWDNDAGTPIGTYILVKDISWVKTWAGSGDASTDAASTDSPSDAPASQ